MFFKKALKRALLVWFCHGGEIRSFLETIACKKRKQDKESIREPHKHRPWYRISFLYREVNKTFR